MRIPHAVLPLCAILLAGCSSSVGPGSKAGEPYLVNTQRTLFYSYGPAQATGPDFALYHGQRVTMLSHEYGYSHIAVEGTGKSGYVATEDLVPAPPSPHPSPTAAPAGHHRHGGKTGNFRPPTPDEESRIPLPEFPEAKPPPGAPPFRY